MIARRDLLRSGLAFGAASLLGSAAPASALGQTNLPKQIGIQVWDMDLISLYSPNLRSEVEKAIQADRDTLTSCLNGYTFAKTVGGKLRDAEVDAPGKTPGMRYDGLVMATVDSIATDEKSCSVLNERNPVDLAITGGIIEHRRAHDDVDGRHLRFMFPNLPNLGYKVLYPLIPPGSTRPETRLFDWEWAKVRGKPEQWRRMGIHVVVQKI